MCAGSLTLHCACSDIVFFGENLPSRFFRRSQEDYPKCDLLIVTGTSLVVHPFAGLIGKACTLSLHLKAQVRKVLLRRASCNMGVYMNSHKFLSLSTSRCNSQKYLAIFSFSAQPQRSSALAQMQAPEMTLWPADAVPNDTPRVLINREVAGEADARLRKLGFNKGFIFGEDSYRDVLHLGDCDASIRRLCQLLDWEEELDALITPVTTSQKL